MRPETSKASADTAAEAPRKDKSESRDCAADADQKHVATAVARAALLGIEARRVPAGAWLLRHAHGADIGIVHGTEALEAAVRGFESARDDVRELGTLDAATALLAGMGMQA